MSEKQLSFECAMMIVGEQKWIKFKDIVRLQEFIQHQQSTIEQLQAQLNECRKPNPVERITTYI